MGLTAENVTYVYDAGTAFAVPALTDADVRVEAGRLTLIVGPSGSGKSTLLALLGGLISPTSGRVLVDGLETPGALHGVVGLVFQDPESQLFADTVRDDVAFGPKNLGAPDTEIPARVEESLEAVGLSSAAFGSRSPFTLSGGEARRVAIAGVLAMRPRYLLLDEPTAGLDADGREAVRTILGEMKGRTGIAVVTHDPEEFLPLADEVVAIANGRVAGTLLAEEFQRDASLLAGLGVGLPDIVRAQLLALERTSARVPLAFDPEAAAAALIAMRDATR